jgi:hypothetical protein
MARMSQIPFAQARSTHGRFAAGCPVGLVLHRTEGHYDNILHAWTVGPNPDQTSAHFLVGKNEYQVVQLVDTNTVANHVRNDANPFYLGIEFESIGTAVRHRQDPATNRDPLTPYQYDIGRSIVNWICQLHGIPKVGPPTRDEMRACRGRWNGVLSHYDIARSGLFRSTHEDEIQFADYMGFGIWPDVPRILNDGFER